MTDSDSTSTKRDKRNGLSVHKAAIVALGIVVALVPIAVMSLSMQKAALQADLDKEGLVKANMVTVQTAAKSYANDHGGAYPASIDDGFKSYFPGPTNPFSNKREYPRLLEDTGAPESSPPGSIGYGSVKGGGGYCIVGYDRKGVLLEVLTIVGGNIRFGQSTK